ncbi:hypothetical protein LHGZ1_2814 [Laribacter hongkongensis]|uniref:Uncharacterized protein n=1 Tax=Laribacter hongkongensis TaxID=168471 RepID=A0A248LM64_9NEIS|nr:hypothetical protein LHGZ1_2814 [Laribacter hongkongensis]
MMKEQTDALFVPILVKMIDAIRVEKRGTALDTMNYITLVKQELRKVGTILASNIGWLA